MQLSLFIKLKRGSRCGVGHVFNSKEYYRQRNARHVGIVRYQLRSVTAVVEFTELFMYYSAHGRLPRDNRVFR